MYSDINGHSKKHTLTVKQHLHYTNSREIHREFDKSYTYIFRRTVKHVADILRIHYTNVSLYQKKVEQKRKSKGSNITTSKGGDNQEMNRFICLAIENEISLQILIVAPLILTSLYILFVENGRLTKHPDNQVKV